MKKIVTLLFFFFYAFILVFSIRGIAGNPTSSTINNPEWKEEGPLELSPDRGRFVLTLSFIEDKSFTFSLPLARFATPDLAYQEGRYVSLFPPGVSFAIIPGYLLGKFFGAAQVGSFAVISLFALANAFLIRSIALRLQANGIAATLAALVFLFATPAFTYAVTLYQHHISTFLILGGVYVLLRWNNLWSLSFIWFLASVSLLVDYPNVFLMAPIAFMALARMFSVHETDGSITLNVKGAGFLTFFASLLPLVFFLWFNAHSYGNPLQLSGTLPRVKAIDDAGRPTVPKTLLGTEKKEELIFPPAQQREKTAVGFFKTRNLLNGFYTHFISLDRGVLWFTPIMFLGSFGAYLFYKRNPHVCSLLLAVAGVNILMYSMWGDPWGGWAFGSRYLIPSYAIFSLFISFVLTRFKTNTVFLFIFFLVLAYSVSVNTLGALTSSANPPQIEIASIEKLSGKEEKYTYMRNYEFLRVRGSKSFMYQLFMSSSLSAWEYYVFMVGTILVASEVMIVFLFVSRGKEEHEV